MAHDVQSKTFMRRALNWLLVLVVLALIVRHWVWMPALIQGPSMLPALRPGQLASINKLVYRFHQPARGDIVSVWTGKEFLVKRIVGLPGEEVSVRNGVVCVNGGPLAEPYVKFPKPSENIAAGRIDVACFAIVGDNRSQSVIAVVNLSRIVGRIRSAPSQ